MMRPSARFGLALVLFLVVLAGTTAAQQVPDLILFNGKIVTVDNDQVNANLGPVAQALAIRGDRVVAVGTNAQVRALAGPATRSLDLKGRTVIPGLAGTHDHPMDWDPLNPLIVQKVVNDDLHIERSPAILLSVKQADPNPLAGLRLLGGLL